jgi:hypothetical protein
VSGGSSWPPIERRAISLGNGKIASRVSSNIGLTQNCVCRNCFGAAPRRVTCCELYGGRSGNRWPDLVVAVSELRHSAMLRSRTRYAANSVTHAELEDHRDWRHVRSGLFSTESAGFVAWPTSASPRNKLATNYLAFIQLASIRLLAAR